MASKLTTALKREAQRLGFSLGGVAAAKPSPNLAAYLDWIEGGFQGEMGYLARPDRLARRRDLNVILPGVKSIFVVGLDYQTLQLPASIAQDPSRGRISNYAWGADYHHLMTPRLLELGAWLTAQTGAQTTWKAYVDTGAILERDHAQAAGLGFAGKNTMLIHPRRGSYFFLGELLTTAQLEADPPISMPSCGKCSRCLDICPTDAFPQPYLLDARRCISYLTIELKGWIPRHLRPMIGNWVYGCDLCQIVCPFNRFAPETTENAFRPVDVDAAAPPLLELLRLNEAAFADRFAGSPIKRIKRDRLLRNVCVAAGNWGDAAAIEPLVQLLSDPSPIIRGHAAWALGKIGTHPARDALRLTLGAELDAQVGEEIQLGLNPN